MLYENGINRPVGLKHIGSLVSYVVQLFETFTDMREKKKVKRILKNYQLFMTKTQTSRLNGT